MKVCFLCSEYPPSPHGGIGSVIQVLARALVRAGHEVRVVGVYPNGHRGQEIEEDQGVQIWRLRAPASRFGWPVARYRLWRQVARWCRNGEIDLVEAPDWEGWIAGWRRLPVPVIVRLHGSVSYFQSELGRPVRKSMFLLERAAMRRADFWCSVSRYTAEKTKQVFGLRSGPDAVLYNPVEASLNASANDRSKTRVVFTGTLTSKKGIVSLIESWPRVRAACESAELHIFGKDGKTETGQSMRGFLEGQLNGDVGRHVHFHGHVAREEILSTLRTARVSVFPSYAEAFAMAPLESMSQGCPTIYSQRGSGPELIETGKHGLLIDPDQTQELADAMIDVLTDDELAARLSAEGRKRVRDSFSVETLLTQNERFYEQCCERFRTKGQQRCS